MTQGQSTRGAADHRSPHPAARVGSKLAGTYRLLRLVARGGVGAVFEAEHLVTGEHFALKVLDEEWAKDEIVARRFAREAGLVRALERGKSPHLVAIVDAGTDGKCRFLVMEYLRGEDLGARLRRERRLPLGEALHVVSHVLRGLSAAHEAGLVHRDLKPDNVLLITHDGDASFAKVVDFGLSRMARPPTDTAPLALTQKGIALGTPYYMAPEQARGLDVDERADLFSVGAILFECLTGRPPHVGESDHQVLLSICLDEAPDARTYAPQLPGDVASFLARALARAREARFASAAEMGEALGVLESRWARTPGVAPPVEAAATSNAGRARRRSRARVAVAAVAAALAGGLTALLGLWMLR